MKTGMQMFSMTGRVVLVTGATGHLGSAMAKSLAEAGAHILVNSRSQERAQMSVDELSGLGLSAEAAAFDVSDPCAIREFFSGFSDRKLNAIINNAYAPGAGTIELSNSQPYIDNFNTVVVAAHNILREALPSLRKAAQNDGDASIINIASMYGLVSPDLSIYDTNAGANPPFYGAAKAAILQWTRYAAVEFGAESIRVNSISPGPFPSVEVQTSQPDFVQRLTGKVPMGRIGQAEEICGPVLFLSSSASSFVNGANIIVDGGWTAW